MHAHEHGRGLLTQAAGDRLNYLLTSYRKEGILLLDF